MVKFAGLRAKMYAIRAEEDKTIKKIKGINSSAVRSISFDDYLECLRANSTLSREQINIRSGLHVLRTETQTKIALSPHDDERYLLEGSTDTLPWRLFSLTSDEVAKEPIKPRGQAMSSKIIIELVKASSGETTD